MLLSVQYLRGLAALSVVFYHAAGKDAQYAAGLFDPFSHWGQMGVDVFFVISGFIMSHSTHDQHAQPGSIRHFIQNRSIRILPLYWVLTLFALLLFLLMPDKINSSGGETRILESFLLLPTPDKFLLQNGWTLSYEFLFYAIFASGLWLSELFGRIWVMLVLVALVACGQFTALAKQGFAWTFLTNPLLLEFFYGMVLYALYQGGRENRILFRVAAILLIIFMGLEVGLHAPLHENRAIVYGIPAFWFCAVIILAEDMLLKYQSKPLQMMGDSSYSLYLLHPFVLAACGLVAGRFVQHWNPWLETAFMLAMLFISLVAGYLCYQRLERPLTKIMKIRRQQPNVALLSVP